MAPDSQVQFAAILVPILGLLVASAVDSVEEGDSGFYRGVVAFFSLAAIGPIAIASVLAIFSVGITIS